MASEARKLLALGAASVLFSLLIIEGIVRLIEPREVLREFFETPDPIVHHKFIPGARGRQKMLEFDATYEINSIGLRSPEIALAKPAGIKRLLILGDSFTEGVGVNGDETFTSQLRGMLERDGIGTGWQVINGGVASYSPLLEYLYLKNGGLALAPDLVILALDLSDVYDDLQYGQVAQFDSHGDPTAVPAEPEREASGPMRLVVGIKDVLKYNTRTYNFVRRRLATSPDPRANARSFDGNLTHDKYGMLRGDPAALSDRAWSRTYDYLLRIRNALHARNAELWIAVYPYGLQISPKEWSSGRVFWGFEADKVYSGRPQELIEAFGRANGIPVVNMLPEFQEAARSTFPLYFDFDGHWLPAGHKVAASSLYKALAPRLRADQADQAR